MEIQVSVTELKTGMYIVDMEGKSAIDASVFSVEGFVLSENEILRLHEQGYAIAYVDPARSRLHKTEYNPEHSLTEFDVVSPTPATSLQGHLVEFHEEYATAKSLQDECLDIGRSIIGKVLNSLELPLPRIQEFLGGIVDSMLRNESTHISLSKLKKQSDIIFSHGLNVAILSVALGRQMNIKAEFLPDLALAGFLHDIGKLFVPEEILNYSGKLNAAQMSEVQSHVMRGYSYLIQYNSLPQIVLDACLDHHERFKGGGYPNSKEGNKISFAGRLVAIADVYDAISSSRIYRATTVPMQALSVMYTDREKDFTPGFLEMLIVSLGVYPPGGLVTLSNKHMAVVVESNDTSPLRPKVVVFADARGVRTRPRLIDLETMTTMSIQGPLLRAPANINVAEAIKSAT